MIIRASEQGEPLIRYQVKEFGGNMKVKKKSNIKVPKNATCVTHRETFIESKAVDPFLL